MTMKTEILDLQHLPKVCLLMYREIQGKDMSMLNLRTNGKASEVIAMIAGAMEGDQVLRAVILKSVDEYNARVQHDQEHKRKREKRKAKQLDLF
jgi:hypothetical protein